MNEEAFQLTDELIQEAFPDGVSDEQRDPLLSFLWIGLGHDLLASYVLSRWLDDGVSYDEAHLEVEQAAWSYGEYLDWQQERDPSGEINKQLWNEDLEGYAYGTVKNALRNVSYASWLVTMVGARYARAELLQNGMLPADFDQRWRDELRAQEDADATSDSLDDNIFERTDELIRSAFPDGVGEGEYEPLLVLFKEGMTRRLLASYVAHHWKKDWGEGYLDANNAEVAHRRFLEQKSSAENLPTGEEGYIYKGDFYPFRITDVQEALARASYPAWLVSILGRTYGRKVLAELGMTYP